MKRKFALFLLLILALFAVSACGEEENNQTAPTEATEQVEATTPPTPIPATPTLSVSASSASSQGQDGVPVLVPEVVGTYPHDPSAYTQGLLLHEGSLYESAGKYGESRLRKVDLTTGQALQETPVDPIYFAEGLALVDDRLIQLTWKEEVALVYDLETLEQTANLEYTGEGWGLCYDQEALYMTDGSSYLFVRNPENLDLLDQIPVTMDGLPVEDLNELECVGEFIYANVYQQNIIVQIDKVTGNVAAVIDASSLLTPEEYIALQSGEVLNGIAYDPAKEIFYITGKHWPKLFEVRFVERE